MHQAGLHRMLKAVRERRRALVLIQMALCMVACCRRRMAVGMLLRQCRTHWEPGQLAQPCQRSVGEALRSSSLARLSRQPRAGRLLRKTRTGALMLPCHLCCTVLPLGLWLTTWRVGTGHFAAIQPALPVLCDAHNTGILVARYVTMSSHWTHDQHYCGYADKAIKYDTTKKDANVNAVNVRQKNLASLYLEKIPLFARNLRNWLS